MQIEGATMGVFPQTGYPKFKLFKLLSQAHEIFKVSKYKENIKFDNINLTKQNLTKRKKKN